MRKVIVFLMALVVLLIVDRAAVASVERDLANRIAAVPSLSGTSAVSIEGIPFLTQAVSGRYPEVRFDLGTFSYGSVQVRNVRGAAYDVTAPLADVLRNQARVQAGRVSVSGTLSRATIDEFAPSGVKIGGNGRRLTASGEVTIGANKVQFNAELRVEVTDGKIRLQAEKIHGVPLPDQVVQLISYPIPFNLPFDVKLTGVRSLPEGLDLFAEAFDVPIRGRAIRGKLSRSRQWAGPCPPGRVGRRLDTVGSCAALTCSNSPYRSWRSPRSSTPQLPGLR
ncbi:LmeA family phospholipid-binding protein [Nonomuraea sp. KM90]|uniref:LmeA family phospholipid-binding protein n=1 Tax=Nonomuraea sp. KM90 TaxID=3457428 RepID=UPI003FCD4E21